MESLLKKLLFMILLTFLIAHPSFAAGIEGAEKFPIDADIIHKNEDFTVELKNNDCNGVNNNFRVVVNFDEHRKFMNLEFVQRISKIIADRCPEGFNIDKPVSIYVNRFYIDHETRTIKQREASNSNSYAGDQFAYFFINLRSKMQGEFFRLYTLAPGDRNQFDPDYQVYVREFKDFSNTQSVSDAIAFYSIRETLIDEYEEEKNKVKSNELYRKKLYDAKINEMNIAAKKSSNDVELLALMGSVCSIWIESVDLPSSMTKSTACGCLVTGVTLSVPTINELKGIIVDFEISNIFEFAQSRAQGVHPSLKACFR